MRIKGRWFLALAVLSLLLLVASAPFVRAGRRHASPISGTISTTLTIFNNSKLVGDVTCDVIDAPCITFGAPDITLKLNGFTITGPANPPSDCTSQSDFAPEDGIVADGQHDVAVLGPGLVRKFRRHGILLSGSTNAHVKLVTVSDNCFSGIILDGTTDSDIEENVSVRNSGGSTGFGCGGT